METTAQAIGRIYGELRQIESQAKAEYDAAEAGLGFDAVRELYEAGDTAELTRRSEQRIETYNTWLRTRDAANSLEWLVNPNL